jgi:hypothetical protein
MPHVPKRPPALAHVSDEAASIVLARRFGDFVAAARDLGVDRKALRRLTWHNPRILNAAHERMDLFHSLVKSKIIAALYSGSDGRPMLCPTPSGLVTVRSLAPGWLRLRARRRSLRGFDLFWGGNLRLSWLASGRPRLRLIAGWSMSTWRQLTL